MIVYMVSAPHNKQIDIYDSFVQVNEGVGMGRPPETSIWICWSRPCRLSPEGVVFRYCLLHRYSHSVFKIDHIALIGAPIIPPIGTGPRLPFDRQQTFITNDFARFGKMRSCVRQCFFQTYCHMNICTSVAHV